MVEKENPANKGKTYAMLVSVGNYNNMQIPNLPTYKADLMFINEAMTYGLLINQDDICLLGSEGIVRAKEVALSLKRILNLLSEKDSFIFYFSGHGKRGELIFSDTSLNLDSVLEFINKLGCKSKLVILDCCHSGDFQMNGPKTMTLEDTIASFMGNGIAIMASSSANEVARLGVSKECSLYTEIVGSAMKSKRMVRKGFLALDDMNKEIFYMMNIWNNQHPDKQQNPIYRSCMGGMIYFKVSDYTPYKQRKVKMKTDKYSIYSVKPLNTDRYKRMCVFIICNNAKDVSLLTKITYEVAETLKYENIFASEAEERKFANKSADAIWCYFGKEERDIVQQRYYVYTIWGSNDEIKKLYFIEKSNAKVADGIYIYQNSCYELVKNMDVPTMSRDAFIEENKRLLAEIVSLAECLIYDVKEIRNGTIDITKFQIKYRKQIAKVRKKYMILSELDIPENDLRQWSNGIIELAGWVADMYILLAEEMGERECWLINNSIRKYYESLEYLKLLEEKKGRF